MAEFTEKKTNATRAEKEKTNNSNTAKQKKTGSSNGDLVNFLIPKDPCYGECYQVFEMNINGKGFAYPRGEWLKIPKEHADFIMERDNAAKMAYENRKQFEYMNIGQA